MKKKKILTVVPILLVTSLLASCSGGNTPTPTPTVYPKVSIKLNDDVEYTIASEVKAVQTETQQSVEIVAYKTTTKDGYLVSDEKLGSKVYLVAELSIKDALTNSSVTYETQSITPKYYYLMSTGYYVYELPSVPTKDTVLTHSFKKEDRVVKVYYKNHVAPTTKTSNYDDLYVSVTINDKVLKQGDNDFFLVKDMDSIIQKELDANNCLSLNAKKGIKFKFFYKDGRVFSSKLNQAEQIWPTSSYQIRTQYKYDNGYHTLFTFAPTFDYTKQEGQRIQFAFEYTNATTKKEWKINDCNFENVNITGATIYNKTEKTIMSVEGDPSLVVDGKKVEGPITIKDLNDSNIKEIKVIYTRAQIEKASGGTTIENIDYVNFNDERTGYKAEGRFVVDGDNAVIYLKNNDLGPQYPFADYISEDGYNIPKEQLLDLKFGFALK